MDQARIEEIFKALDIQDYVGDAHDYAVHTPISGAQIGSVSLDDASDVAGVVERSVVAFESWRMLPAP